MIRGDATFRGLFVTFEGVEGCGKTTQVRRAASRLRRRGLDPLVTRQPGGTPLGRRLRALLLRFPGAVDPRSELLLLFADRRQHLTEAIEPALAAGRLVLCDRYTDASRAYQGAGRGLGEETVDALHDRFCVTDPDRTYLFDCPVEVALARLTGPGRPSLDRIEREEKEFHETVRQAYLRRASQEPERFLVLDATLSVAALSRLVAEDLDRLLEGRR